jgi:hypothetical protein
LECSFADPDIDGIEDEVIHKILEQPKPFDKYLSETLYFIFGFLLTATLKEVQRRKSKGSSYHAFVEQNSLER